jgi:hypothetical protein
MRLVESGSGMGGVSTGVNVINPESMAEEMNSMDGTSPAQKSFGIGGEFGEDVRSPTVISPEGRNPKKLPWKKSAVEEYESVHSSLSVGRTESGRETVNGPTSNGPTSSIVNVKTVGAEEEKTTGLSATGVDTHGKGKHVKSAVYESACAEGAPSTTSAARIIHEDFRILPFS